MHNAGRRRVGAVRVRPRHRRRVQRGTSRVRCRTAPGTLWPQRRSGSDVRRAEGCRDRGPSRLRIHRGFARPRVRPHEPVATVAWGCPSGHLTTRCVDVFEHRSLASAPVGRVRIGLPRAARSQACHGGRETSNVPTRTAATELPGVRVHSRLRPFAGPILQRAVRRDVAVPPSRSAQIRPPIRVPMRSRLAADGRPDDASPRTGRSCGSILAISQEGASLSLLARSLTECQT
jgi:hypothetical protein